ncbi:MAG: ATP-dependent DNA helicase RecG, partial [Ferruginibacter sp.]
MIDAYYLCYINTLPNILQTPIEYLTGISVQRGELLRKELSIHTYNDFINHFPFRHVDKTQVDTIAALSTNDDYAYVAGKLLSLDLLGDGRSKRLVGRLNDNTGVIELVWFQGINHVEKILHVGQQYLLFGKLSFFMGTPQIAHPEIENFSPQKLAGKPSLEPIYPCTEKLKSRGINGNNIGKFTQEVFTRITQNDIPENLPQNIIEHYKLMGRFDSYKQIHFPSSEKNYQLALRRLKFDELFFAQLRMNLVKLHRHRFSRGSIFDKVGGY